MNAIHSLRGFKRNDAHSEWPVEWLWNTPMATLAQSHIAISSKPQRFGVVPISTLRLALTMWNGTSKVHYEQLGLGGLAVS